VVLTKRENIKELVKWCHGQGIPMTQKELQGYASHELQIARRAACFHGSFPRLIRQHIADRERQKAQTAPDSQARKPESELIDWKKAAANDRS